MAFRHYAGEPFVMSTLVLVLLLSHAHKSFAASGGSAGGSAGGGGSGGGSAISDGASSENETVIIVVMVLVGLLFGASMIACIGKRTILILQVGLTGEPRPSLQRQINLTATATDTSSVEGWHHILIETTNALLRHSQHFISAYSSVEKRWSNQDVIEKFKQVSKEEHKKFDIESLVNFNSVRSHRHVDPQPREPDKDYIVVTILVATKCGYNAPPTMNTIDDIKEALKFFIAIDINQILAVEVLWTPQHENDTLSQQELEGKYPLLKPINAS